MQLDRVADKRAQRHARHFERRLKGQKHAQLGALVGGHMRDVFPLEHDLAFRHMITRAAHQRVAQRGFTRSIRPHEHMGFARADFQIDVIQNRLIFNAHAQALDGQKLFFHCIDTPLN